MGGPPQCVCVYFHCVLLWDALCGPCMHFTVSVYVCIYVSLVVVLGSCCHRFIFVVECVCMHVRIHCVCVCVYACMHACVCVHACLHACVCVCVNGCVHALLV